MSDDGWIKCSERIPEAGYSYLTLDARCGYKMAVRFLSDDNEDGRPEWESMVWDSENGPAITHWRPLPQPPRDS
jgi:hypothetical protein